MTLESESLEGTKRMERLRFRIKQLLTGIAALSLGIAFIIGFSLLAWYDEVSWERVKPEPFDAFQESRDCSIQIQLLLGPFASSQDEKLNFYWGYGMMMEPAILLFEGELPEECRALLEFAGSQESMEMPLPVTVRGRSVTIENTDIYDYALEYYQTMWGLKPMNRNEFKQSVATCCLEAGKLSWLQKLPWYGAVLVFLLPLALLAVGFLECRAYLIRQKRERRRLALLSSEEKQTAAYQLGSASEFEPHSRIYLTADYIITGNDQFDIIPYKRIASLEEAGGYLIAVTADGMAHIVLSSGHKKLSGIPWLSRLKKVLEEKIRYAQEEGEDYAAISGD